MNIYYLMVKTHNITGLKYLCQTKKKDPYKYLGSGKYWKLHLKEHGNDISTEILKECYTKDNLIIWGKYYSDLWNVTESNAWANLKPETGDGGPLFGAANGMFGKSRPRHIMEKAWEASSKAIKGKTLEDRYGVETAARMREIRRINTANAMQNDPEWVTRLLKCANSPEAIEKRSGKNHTRYDHTIYTWHHTKTDTTVLMTRSEFSKAHELPSSNISNLINGKHKHCKGWSIIKT